MAIPLSRSADELIRLLRRVLTQGGNANVLVVQAGEAAACFRAERGNPLLRCELVSNRELSPAARLSEADLVRLERMGFRIPHDGKDYWRDVAIEDEAALADLAHQTVRVLTSIYGCEARQIVSFRCDLRDSGPVNPEVVGLLEAIHAHNTNENWAHLLQALRQARLIVPVDARNNAVILQGDGRTNVLPVFTDYDAVVAHWPDGHAFIAMPGAELFPWAWRHRLWPVVLNPAGPVAGELGESEVAALAVEAGNRVARAPVHAGVPARPVTSVRRPR